MRDRMRKTIITLLVVIAMLIGIMPFAYKEVKADGEDVQEITSVTVNVPRPRVGELLESATVDEDQPYSRVRYIWLYSITTGIVMPADVELPADDAGKIVYVEIVLGSEGESVFSDSLSASDVTIPGAIEIVKFNNSKTTLTLGASFEVLSDNSIPEITLSVTPPVVGRPTSGNGAVDVTVPEGVHCLVSVVTTEFGVWLDAAYDRFDSVTFQPEDAGKEATARIELYPYTGYTFANPVTVKIDGVSRETVVYGEDENLICYVFFKIQEGIIDSVTLIITPPKAGDPKNATPDVKVPDGANYQISSVTIWHDGSGMSYTDGTFADGDDALVAVSLSSADGYKFADKLSVTAEGSNGTDVFSSDGKVVDVVVEYLVKGADPQPDPDPTPTPDPTPATPYNIPKTGIE